jgi:hypothetical protein
MKQLIIIMLLLANYSFAQNNGEFLTRFLLEDELKPGNVIEQYSQYDFSGIWTQTENYCVLGIIGDDNQRIRIRMTSVKKNPNNPSEYLVTGKSNVKGNICDFSGTIKLIEVNEFLQLNFGVDNEFIDKGIKSQGILIADYEFNEDPAQAHPGIFSGKLYSKWYVDAQNKVRYDNIQANSDDYMNNAFIGTWRSYSPGMEIVCNWGDYRVPLAKPDFDIGAGEFSVGEKYLDKGWDNYQKAWLYGNEDAKKEELKEWWK